MDTKHNLVVRRGEVVLIGAVRIVVQDTRGDRVRLEITSTSSAPLVPVGARP